VGCFGRFGHLQRRLAGLHGAAVFIFQGFKGQGHAALVLAFNGNSHRIGQGGGLLCLALLPQLPAVPGGKTAQYHDQNTGDRGAPLVPKMLELVKLFLFF